MAADARFSPIAVLAAMLVALPGPAAAAQPRHGFDVGGLSLGMVLADFKSVYSEAGITVHEAVRYCFGRRVVLTPLNWITATGRRGDTTVRVTFHRHNDRFRLTELIQIETTDIKPTDNRKLRALKDRLVARNGPYTRLLTRRKMEPDGRIVGFVWSHADGQTLRVEIHQDHARNTGLVLIDTRLSKTETDRRGAQAKQAALDAFRRQCKRPAPKP